VRFGCVAVGDLRRAFRPSGGKDFADATVGDTREGCSGIMLHLSLVDTENMRNKMRRPGRWSALR